MKYLETFRNEQFSFEERATDLVARLTLEEKMSQVGTVGAAIPRLGIPSYGYWSEASHGLFDLFGVSDMPVTSYPVCLAMSQTWDTARIGEVGKAISDECRAYNNLEGKALHYYCPTVNMARDPRNGRSDENFGEDTFLAGKMAAGYIKGFQGRRGKYVKAVCTPKHFALNSSENNRHRGSSNADEASIREYYTKVFERAIIEGQAESLMTGYNRVNGVPSAANEYLINQLLRMEWGFDGFVVSDCGGVGDTYDSPMFNVGIPGSNGHYYAKSAEEASAITIKVGNDMTCGSEHRKNLMNALSQGLITEGEIDRALIRIFTSRFRLGLFDEVNPFEDISPDIICGPQMQQLSIDMANDTIVLLKNDKNLLPLQKDQLKKVLVVGPNAFYRELGGYSPGTMNPNNDTVRNTMALDGIRKELNDSGVEVLYEQGWKTEKELASESKEEQAGAGYLPGADPVAMMMEFFGEEFDFASYAESLSKPFRYEQKPLNYGVSGEELLQRAVNAAKEVDCVIIVAGNDASTAAEEHDRTTLELPYHQDSIIQQLMAANDNTVVVLVASAGVTGSFFDRAHTILNAHYAGQEQGVAIANVLFGKVNPNAKLTATWYRDVDDLPHLNDYGLCWQDTLDGKDRTYMYFRKDVLFPFGHGLSYTTFEYENMKVNKEAIDANDELEVSVDVVNTGKCDGGEIVELYVRKVFNEKQYDKKPIRQLKGFDKVWLKAGEKKTVSIKVPVKEISFWSSFHKKMIVESGTYCIEIGRSSADIELDKEIQITGVWNAGIRTVYAVSNEQILSVGDASRLHTSVTLEDATHLGTKDAHIVYESGDPSVVTVDQYGCVSAVGPGTAEIHITATFGESTRMRKVPFSVRGN